MSPCILMKLSYHRKVDFYNNAASFCSTVFLLQDPRRCRYEKDTALNYFIFKIEKFKK